MATKPYIHEEAVARSRRAEEDLRQRLQLRLGKSYEAGNAHAPTADPVAKRLAFLLAQARKRRQDLEQMTQAVRQ